MKVDIPSSEEEGLYPLQALVEPISLRFKYHFEGSRLTNKLDKVNAFFYTHNEQAIEA
jgi:hypothetical protein